MQFVIEYKSRSRIDVNAPSLSTIVPLDGENLQMVQREVERNINDGAFDEAFIYQAVRQVRAERRVTSTAVPGPLPAEVQ